MVKTLIVFFVLTFQQLTFATAFERAGIVTATLNNGLKIIIKVDNRAPVFISQLWYRVGSSDEKRPTTGVSHMLEHMMFKGTTQYPAGDFSKIIARNGGEENAFTSKDYTAYYQEMHTSKLALALKLEADRMRHLTFSYRELEKERQVVIEERRLRVEDNPFAKVYENLSLISFDEKGAYHTPVIGFQQDLDTYNLRHLRHWYAKYYAPNNATLVVVGDVNPTEVIALAKQYFGQYERNLNITDKDNFAITKTGQSRVLRLKAQLPFYVLSFPVPSLKTAIDKHDARSLDMLAYVLENGLSKTLVRNQQIASSLSVGYNLYDRYDTLFIVSFIPAQGVSNETVLTSIKTQIAELLKNPTLIQGELTRTKAQLEADFVFKQDKISTQSYYLGRLSSIGLSIKNAFNYVEKMNAINTKDVAQAAKKYLNFPQSNSVELIALGIK